MRQGRTSGKSKRRDPRRTLRIELDCDVHTLHGGCQPAEERDTFEIVGEVGVGDRSRGSVVVRNAAVVVQIARFIDTAGEVVNILVVDDEVSLRRTIRTALESMGHRVSEAGTSGEALHRVSQGRPDLVLLDLRLGRESGLDVLEQLLKASAGLGVVVITAYAAVDTAVEAMRRGALDYLAKPFTPKQLAELIDRWCDRAGAENDDEGVLSSAEPSMQLALQTAFAVAARDATVLLRGESGTGKGVLARAIHARSRRASKPFATVHCPSLSAELLESELFGHTKGAFTGADRATEGRVTSAEGGTLFLDEIGDLPLRLQP